MKKMKIVALVLATLILVCIIFFEPLRFIDNLFYDVNFAFSPKAATDSVVVVAFDTKSLSTIGGWPWSRSKIAEVIEKINLLDPKVIALDILLPKRDTEEHNIKLAAALSRVSNCIVPFRAVGISEKIPENPPHIPQSVFRHRFLRLKNQKNLENIGFYRVTDFDASDTLFSGYSRYSGFINVSMSNTSQKLREIVHVVRAGDEYFPSFGLSAVAAYLELKPEEFILDGRAKLWLGEKKVPISTYAATAFINFRSQAKPIVTVSALDILNGSIRKDTIEGKLVFLGVDDPAAGADFFITPIASQYPGVKVWATAALDILEQAWVTNGGTILGVFNWLLALIIFPGLAILGVVSRKQISIILGGGLLLLSIVISYLLFQHYSYFWNPAHHVYAWIFSLIWIATLKPGEVTQVIEPLQLEPSQDSHEYNPEPPSESYVLPEVPNTVTALHVINTIVPDATGNKTRKPRNRVDNVDSGMGDDVDTIVVSSSRNAAERKQPGDSPDVSDESIVKFQNLCNGKIVTVLGSGGMADVYLIWNPRLEVYRAVKVFKPEQAVSYADRFETEIRIFSKLDHPNIVRCYGVGEWHSLPYLEMEYVNGASLEEIIRKYGAVSAEQAAIIGLLVCRALHYAHHQTMTIYGKTYNGVIHRDLKPANVLFSRSGRIKLTDFGIARPASVRLHTEDAGNIVGTLPYLSPEQLDGQELDVQTDIYALGITIHELLTGKRAFPQKEVTSLVKAKTLGKVDVQLSSVPGIPKQLIEIVDKAIAPEKHIRYRNAKEMGADLEDFIRNRTANAGYMHVQQLVNKIWA